jgi:hypothetical protein
MTRFGRSASDRYTRGLDKSGFGAIPQTSLYPWGHGSVNSRRDDTKKGWVLEGLERSRSGCAPLTRTTTEHTAQEKEVRGDATTRMRFAPYSAVPSVYQERLIARVHMFRFFSSSFFPSRDRPKTDWCRDPFLHDCTTCASRTVFCQRIGTGRVFARQHLTTDWITNIFTPFFHAF